jgi:hypothetical protein
MRPNRSVKYLHEEDGRFSISVILTEETDIEITTFGHKYSDVASVKTCYTVVENDSVSISTSQNYYAKGIGLVKTVDSPIYRTSLIDYHIEN